MKSYNESYYDSYAAIYSLLAFETEQLKRHYPSSNIEKIDDYKTNILHKCAIFFHTLFYVVVEAHDYYSAGTLIRMIADTLSSYNLIYHDSDKETTCLRHYLFILDGLCQRKKYFDCHQMNYDNTISMEVYKRLELQVSSSKENTLNAIDICKSQITKLDIYKAQKENVDMLIEKRNWQFIDVSRPKGHYKWEQLYPMLDNKKAFSDMITFLSQFVHGLSISNLTIDNSLQDFEPLLAYGITLMSKTMAFIKNDFELSRNDLFSGFLNSPHFSDYFSVSSENKKDEILRRLRSMFSK